VFPHVGLHLLLLFLMLLHLLILLSTMKPVIHFLHLILLARLITPTRLHLIGG
jgi:hypothetical protein